jgi:hypothetical protein
MNVFISYSHLDETYATKIAEDLTKQNIGIWIDKKCIKPGDLWLKEIDEGLREADYVLGIVTNNYLKSTGGIEAYATLGNGLKNKKINLISLFFEDIKNINSVILPAFQGFDFSKDYSEGLLSLIKHLKSEEPESSVQLLSKIEGEHSQNPFRRTRAEFFKNDYILAKAFARPEKERYELVRDRIPLFIFGGRGSGKTMILKSLTPEVIASRLQLQTFKEAKEKGINYIGIYLRLIRGSFSLVNNDTILRLGFLSLNVPQEYALYKNLWEKLSNSIIDEPVINAGLNAAQRIFLDEINFKLLIAVLQKLKYLQTAHPMIDIDIEIEQKIVSLIMQRLNPSLTGIRSFNDLLVFFNGELDKIKDYLQKITLPFAGSPSVNWVTTGPDFLDYICKIFIDTITDLKDTKIYLLLDEYENLLAYQQMIINEWVKTSNNIVIKIGVKFEGMYTNMTLQGQQLQFKVGECDEISLDYNLFSDADFKNYQDLLKKICFNLLEIEGYEEKNIQNILETPAAPELLQEVIDEEIKKIAGINYKDDKIKEYRNKLEVAAIFRLLRQKEKVEGRKSRKKVYAGFDTYTYLSSGIIRVFLNLGGMAFYRAEGSGINVKEGQKISVEHQSWSARIVSKGYLERIHKNVEAYGGINGEIIYQFVTDVGDIFREKLLFHPSEPETLSISLSDPHHLNSSIFIKNLLCHSVRESILYKKEETSSYRPKQTTGVRTKDYVLNRVYTPALELSHRARWGRCKFSVNELDELLNPKMREKTKKMIQQRQRVKEKQEMPELFRPEKQNE